MTPTQAWKVLKIAKTPDVAAIRRVVTVGAPATDRAPADPGACAGDDARDARWIALADLEGHELATSFGVARLW